VVSTVAFLGCGTAANAAVILNSQNTTFLPALPVNPEAPDFQISGILDFVAAGGGVPATSDPWRSPYQDANGVTYPAAGYATAPYWSVQNGAAGYNFTGGLTSLDFLWGSPDDYNTLEFYTGLNGTGVQLATASASGTGFTRGDLTLPVPATSPNGNAGHVWINFLSDIPFLSIVLRSGSPAFEHYIAAGGDNQNPVPLPPALLLFGSALLGMHWLGRRRRSSGMNMQAAAA
jgi:hypothetical protein